MGNYQISEYDLLVENEVDEKLQKLPGHKTQIESLREKQKNNNLSFYVRSISSWALKCEADPKTSRAGFNETVGTSDGLAKEND